MADPVKGQPYEFSIPLVAVEDPASFVLNPTIAAGDFQISQDGGPYINLANLPVVSPALSSSVLFSLTGAEMDADRVVVNGIDVTGNEWEDVQVLVPTPTGSSESVFDIIVGDVTENSVLSTTVKRGTAEVLLEKAIAGSQLNPNITIQTTDAP